MGASGGPQPVKKKTPAPTAPPKRTYGPAYTAPYRPTYNGPYTGGGRPQVTPTGGGDGTPWYQKINQFSQAAAGVNDILGTPASDPLAGMNWQDLLAGFGLNDKGKPKGNGGGGGGGKSAAQTAAEQAQMSSAYKQMLDALNQGFTDQNGLIQGQIGALGTQFDQRGQSLQDMYGQSNSRLDQILQELNGGVAPVRQAVQGAWSEADARQAALAQELSQANQGRTQGAAQTLGMFGGDPGQLAQNYGPQDLIGLQRASMGSMAAAQDASLAGRPAIYGGLQADVSTRNSQQLTQLQAQLAQQRAQQLAALQASQVQAQMQAAQQRAQLAMQAAKDGVTF